MTCVNARQSTRTAPTTAVTKIGVTVEGLREARILDLGPSEDGAFRLAFLRSQVVRRFAGLRVFVSDTPRGLK